MSAKEPRPSSLPVTSMVTWTQKRERRTRKRERLSGGCKLRLEFVGVASLTYLSPHYRPPVSAEVDKKENQIVDGHESSLTPQARLPPRPQYGELGTEVVLRIKLFHLHQNENAEIFRYIVMFKADREAQEKRKLKEAKQGKKAEDDKEENFPEETRPKTRRTYSTQTSPMFRASSSSGTHVCGGRPWSCNEL